MPLLPTRLVACALVLLLAVPSAPRAAAPPAQDAAPATDVPEIPHDMQPFWRLYLPAKESDDEAGMDKAVRTYPQLAERVLDLLIDDVCSRDRGPMHDELRTLAWSLDRVRGLTRYIERVRLVLEMDAGKRRQRQRALNDLADAQDLFKAAATEKSPAAWKAALDKYTPVATELELLGDFEFAVAALNDIALVEAQLQHPWEQGQALKRLMELAGKLSYPDAMAEAARQELARLAAAGVDPDAPKAGGGAGDGGGGTGGGSLEKFAAGAEEQSFTLEPVSPRKGLEGIVLPGFAPLEQYFLWPFSWLDKNGPTDFDVQRVQSLRPWGAGWTFSRSGSKYSIDSNGDGEPDVTFTPSSTPQRIEVPAPDGKGSWPLMVSVPGDKESMFGLDVNYSPQDTGSSAGARLRFNIAGSMDGKVLDEPWKILDENLTGVFGDAIECFDDRVTPYVDTDRTHWWEDDSVLVGKSRVAQPWSTVMPVGDAFYRATLAPDGRTLGLRLLDLPTGFIKLDLATAVPPTHVVVRETGSLQGAFFNVVPARKGGSVKVPAGKYELAWGRLESGHKTSLQQARMYTGHSEGFELAAGETHVLALGAPYKLAIATKQDGEEFVVEGTSLRIRGRGGEEWAALFDDALHPDVEARTADGKKFAKPQKMPTTGITEWQESSSPSVLWFPLDLRLQNPHQEKLQVRLTARTQALLGGPFDSDWMP